MPSPAMETLASYYSGETSRIQEQFEKTGQGRAVLAERSRAVDELIRRMLEGLLGAGAHDLCLVALGGYGRQELFPHSDIDLMFLFRDARGEAERKDAIATFSRTLWDLKLRVSATARTLEECARLNRQNLEFSVSLLDSRWLEGDRGLFDRLRNEFIPRLVKRDAGDLAADLIEASRRRRSKHGDTIFHLEPNVKEAPGGLRDYHVAEWLAAIAALEREGLWAPAEEAWPRALAADAALAFDFLAATRCFQHFHARRDDNHLTYEVQDAAAEAGIGVEPGRPLPPDEWMRHYFRHARSIDRLSTRVVEDAQPARSSLYGVFQDLKSRFSTPDFSVVRGRLYVRQPFSVPKDLSPLVEMFGLVARHGLELSREAEAWVRNALAAPARGGETGIAPGELWRGFREILVAPQAARALRAMHRLGLLDRLFPEFRAIDALVVRDYFHRYTVDEHSITTIESLHGLEKGARAGGAAGAPAGSLGGWSEKFGEILGELEQPELLYLALLFHDVGKGMPAADHVQGSLEALGAVFERLALDSKDREAVRFLVASHLEMSATMQRRDVFDPETVRPFAGKVETAERLKMLCLLTFADIRSVNPEALTPWKAELLWRLYASTANFLSRSADEARLEPSGEVQALAERIRPLLSTPVAAETVVEFLQGFPRRYLPAHSPQEVAAHFEMARALANSPAELRLSGSERLHELVVVTRDRPMLFASLTGALSAWGMNIVKADAFANAAGVVLDTVQFVDLHRTLELNPQEIERFKGSIADVLAGRADLESLLKGRLATGAVPRPKVSVATQLRFDDESSSHSTLLEVITQDRPGLLYDVSSVIAGLGINIEVALIDTEGQKVIDVFYLTRNSSKLPASDCAALRAGLLERLTPRAM